MIVLDLHCTNDHRFEGWFGSAAAFGAARARSRRLSGLRNHQGPPAAERTLRADRPCSGGEAGSDARRPAPQPPCPTFRGRRPPDGPAARHGARRRGRGRAPARGGARAFTMARPRRAISAGRLRPTRSRPCWTKASSCCQCHRRKKTCTEIPAPPPARSPCGGGAVPPLATTRIRCASGSAARASRLR